MHIERMNYFLKSFYLFFILMHCNKKALQNINCTKLRLINGWIFRSLGTRQLFALTIKDVREE